MQPTLTKSQNKFNTFLHIDPVRLKRWKFNITRLGTAFMFPVALLPVAGLFLGIGSMMTAQISDHGSIGYLIGNLFSNIGSVAFVWMPLFFAISTTLCFTNNSGYAGATSAVGYLFFTFIQTAFITPYAHGATEAAQYFTYDILFYKDLNQGIFQQLGVINFLNTSVVGGIIVGLVIALLFNRYKYKKLPMVLSFFNDERFVPIVAIPAMFLLAGIFMEIWPAIGMGLTSLGQTSANWPGGLDSFFGNWLERILLPFGLAYIIWPLFFYTNAGGTVNSLQDFLHSHLTTGQTVADFLTQHGTREAVEKLFNQYGGSITGDQRIWVLYQTAGIPFDNNLFNPDGTFMVGNPGRFSTGRFPAMMFGLSGVALALYLAAEKHNRKKVGSLMIGAVTTCVLTGTTQPVEYAFLFSAPVLFAIPYTIMFAGCGLLMNVLGTHLVTFYSGGLIDLFVYNVPADALGLHVKTWGVAVIGIPAFFIFFGVFYGWIKYFDTKTIGRDIIALQTDQATTAHLSLATEEVASRTVAALGGAHAINSIEGCSTRLRVKVENANDISVTDLKEMGASNVIIIDAHNIEIVFQTLPPERLAHSIKTFAKIKTPKIQELKTPIWQRLKRSNK